MKAAAALPVGVAPREGESIESWLEHLGDANGSHRRRCSAFSEDTAAAPDT